MSVWGLLPLAFLAGWYAHWYFKLRPYARIVEEKALEIQAILQEAEKRGAKKEDAT